MGKIMIFDFDGTLADTTEVIVQIMQASIRELALPVRTDEECASTIGLRLTDIPSALFPEHIADKDIFTATYRRLAPEFYKTDSVRLYPNVLETLIELKERGVSLAIASSRSKASLEELVERLGLSSLISYIVGAEDVTDGKPCPEPVYHILEKFAAKPEDAIVIGDTVFDIQMGKRAGARTCGITHGNGSRESLIDADWVIDEFDRLPGLIV